MNAKTARILKEARPLFWPWCAVTMAGALPLLHPFDWAPLIALIGFFAIPLLATLSFGGEFQHRTLSLLLSQPVGRMKIWGEKLGVTFVAIVSAVLVFSLALRATSFHPARQELAFAGAWIVAIIASATFWTLFTRSTVGGVALNIGVQSSISFIVPWVNLVDRLRARGYLSPGNHIVVSTVAFVFLCYAGVMVWLGGRRFARLQVTGGMAGDDLLMAGPDLMPGAWAGWLRSRPTGAVLNLIRKELRLLRPLWLISLLAAVGWACLTLFDLLFERGFSRNFETAVVIMGVGSTLMIAILAGSLSLGEERTSGTHAWHLTLPVSALLQWRIKLYMALFAGLVGAGLLPMLIAGRLFGSSRIFVDVHFGMGWLFVVLILTFASFWCACAANGTVRAVLWVSPVIIVLGLASQFGERVGREFMDLLVSRFGVFENFKFTHAVAAMFQPSATLGFVWDVMYSEWDAAPILSVLLVPTLLLAVIQSYRRFRAQLQDSLSLVRSLLPLGMVAFLCSFSLMAFITFVDQAWQQDWIVRFEAVQAIENIQRRAAKLEVTHPLQLTEEDLAKASPLSARTQRWLRSSHVTIVPLKGRPRQFLGPEYSKTALEIDGPQSWYLATIHIAGGSDCTRSFWRRTDDFHVLYVVCQ